MKKLFIVFLVLNFFVFACKNSDNNSDEDNQTEVVDNDEDAEKFVRVELEHLPEIIASQTEEFQTKFEMYFKALNTEVKSEKQILAIFELRDSLIRDFNYILDTYYYENETDWESWDLIDKELLTIGFCVIYAEGMYVGIDISPILEDEIEEYASEEFKLFIEFNNRYSLSRGGEYPFMSILPYFDVVYIGEKLYELNQNSEYFEQIYDKYLECLMITVDLHKIQDECFYSDFNYGFYPYASDCSGWNTIISDCPDSRFVGIYQNLLDNTSEITINQNLDYLSDIYVVATDKFEKYEEMNWKIFDYLHQEIDIVHPLTFDNNGETEYYVAYRFYSNKDRAFEALDYISSIAPNAKIIKVRFHEEFTDAVVREIY